MTYFYSAAMQTVIAIISGWVAFGDGPRQFWHDQSLGPVSVHSEASESYGRTMFSVGCVLVSALATLAWRKFFKSLHSQ